MLLLIALVVGWALGLACRGEIRRLSQVRLRGEWLLLGALAAQALMPVMRGTAGPAGSAAHAVWLASFPFLALVALSNADREGLAAVGVGAGLNSLAIAANGHMPVSYAAMKAAGFTGGTAPLSGGGVSATHALVDQSTCAVLLADVVPLPNVLGLQAVVSVGDVLLVVGVASFVCSTMVKAPPR